MRRRVTRAALVATMLCALLVPAAGSAADPESELEQTRTELDAVRQRIELDEVKVAALKRRIDVINAGIADLEIEINRLDADIARIESRVRTAQAQIDATQDRIDRIEETATDQAVALYKAGAVDTLDALLDTESIAELNDRIEMIGVAAQENISALVRYNRLRFEIEHQQEELFEKKRVLLGKRRGRARVLATRNDLRAQLSDELAELTQRLGEERVREGHLEEEAEDVRGEIVAAQAQTAVASQGAVASPGAVASRGTSAHGFIWPLNGPITSGYGSRWGGMHTGIDIDGYTGQPVVASKSGRVILASSYYGYGYTVIIDHGGGISTLYAHLSGFNASTGQTVAQADVVGYVGCTGSCTGDHLHFEVRVNGSPVNPLSYLP